MVVLALFPGCLTLWFQALCWLPLSTLLTLGHQVAHDEHHGHVAVSALGLTSLLHWLAVWLRIHALKLAVIFVETIVALGICLRDCMQVSLCFCLRVLVIGPVHRVHTLWGSHVTRNCWSLNDTVLVQAMASVQHLFEDLLFTWLCIGLILLADHIFSRVVTKSKEVCLGVKATIRYWLIGIARGVLVHLTGGILSHLISLYLLRQLQN